MRGLMVPTQAPWRKRGSMAKQRAPKNPLPPNYIPPAAQRHEVVAGESLASIAQANGMTENELNIFNFGTTVPEEINWYLEHRVKCKKQTHDHMNWMFTTESPRLFIYLPAAKSSDKPPRGTPGSRSPLATGPDHLGAQPVAAVLAGPDVEARYEIPLPTIVVVVPVTSPVLVSVSGKIVAKGYVKADGSHSKISVTTDKADIELRFKEKFGEVKLKTSITPGHISKVGLEWTPNDIPIGIEFAANADYTKPFTLAGKWKNAIKLDDFKLGDHLTFSGSIDPQLEFNFAPNPAWPGWQATARAALQGGRVALQSGANAVRGVFIAEEAGTLTAVGAATLAVAVAAGYVAFVAFGLYQIGKAHRTGRILAVRYAFAGGYASVLTGFTSDVWTFRRDEVERWLSIDWKRGLSMLTSIYVNGSSTGEAAYIPDLETMGKAAIAQDIDDYIKKNGMPAWDKIRKKHQSLYGTSYMDRRSRYFLMLRQQIESGRETVGIPILQ